MPYKFTWSPNKNRTNRLDHEGVSFELAAQVWDDENRLIVHDRYDHDGFERLHAIGCTRDGGVLLVVHIEKGEDENGEEIIHILSARKADKRTVRRYFQQADE